jgi:hypothetical protein
MNLFVRTTRTSGLSGIVAGSRALSFFGVFLAAGLFMTLTGRADASMPVPSGQHGFMYAAAGSAFSADDPSAAKPLGVGSVASGGDNLSVSVSLFPVAGPVDVYIAFILSSDPDFYFLNPGGESFHVVNLSELIQATSASSLPAGVWPWKAGTTGFNDSLFSMPIEGLPSGVYTAFVLVTPAGSLLSYYLWDTSFQLPPPVCHIDTACSAGGQLQARDNRSNACIASSSCTLLYACQEATTGGSCGGWNKCTQSPGCSSGVQRCSDGICTGVSTCGSTNIAAGCAPVASGVCYVDTACSAGGQLNARDSGSNTCVASSGCTSLHACQAAITGGSCGGSNKCTQSPGCSSGIQRCSDGICTGASTCDGSNIAAGCSPSDEGPK